MSAPVEVGKVGVEHPFMVVKSLIAGVILGIDFLRQHELVLDFAFSPIKVLSHNQPVVAADNHISPYVQQIWKRASKVNGELGTIMAIGECAEDVVNDCAIPSWARRKQHHMDCHRVLHLIYLRCVTSSRSCLEVHQGLRQ